MTNPPEEVLRQLGPEERVLWHARPRFRQLRRRARLLVILTLIACLLAWMGHHSTGIICPEGWVLCYLLLLALPLSELIGTLWYLFTTAQTHYTLTNHRAIVSRGSQMEEYPLEPDMLAQVRHWGSNCASVFFFIEAKISLFLEHPRVVGKGFADTPQADTLLRLLAEHAGATQPRQEAIEKENWVRETKLKKQGRKSQLITGIAFCILGFIFLTISVGEVITNVNLLQNGTHTTGMVLDSRPGKEIDIHDIKVGRTIDVDILMRYGNDTLRFTQSCYNGTDERYFTPGAALPLVYLDNPASARIALPWEMSNEFMWAILFLLLSLSAGIYVLTTYLRAHRKLKHFPNS